MGEFLKRMIWTNCKLNGYLSFREKIAELAANAGVVSTVQEAAQQCLQVAWVILMPRAEERAKALSGVDITQSFSYLSSYRSFSMLFQPRERSCNANSKHGFILIPQTAFVEIR